MLRRRTAKHPSEGVPDRCARVLNSGLGARTTNLTMSLSRLLPVSVVCFFFGGTFHIHALPFSASIKAGGPVDNGFVKSDAGSSSSGWAWCTARSIGEDRSSGDSCCSFAAVNHQHWCNQHVTKLKTNPAIRRLHSLGSEGPAHSAPSVAGLLTFDAVHRGTWLRVSLSPLYAARNRDTPSGDEDFLVAIVEDAGQFAFDAAIAWLRPAAFDLLSATSSAAMPRRLAAVQHDRDRSPYAFSDLFATREPFPAMRTIDLGCRMRCRHSETGAEYQGW